MAVNSLTLGTDSIIGVANVGTDVTGSFTTIGGVVSGSLTIEHNSVDTTNNDDSGFTSFKPGNTTITLSVECRYDPVEDSAQSTIESIAADVDNGGTSFKALKSWLIQPAGNTSGESEFAFDGYVTSFDISMGNDEVVNLSFEVTSVGASVATAAPSYGAVP